MRINLFCRATLLILSALPAVPGCQTPPRPSVPSVSLSTPFRSNAWNTPYGPGQEIITRHYRIYTTVRDPNLLAILPGFLEAAHTNDLIILKQPDRPMELPVYMLATRQEWEALTTQRFGGPGPARVIEDGGYTYNGVVVCWAIGRTATLAVASHEGMHQILYHSLRDRLPLWAEEGLATTAEGFVIDRDRVRFTPDNNTIRLSDLRQAILDDHWLPLKDLLATNTMAVAQQGGMGETVGYYGQLYGLMNFLRHSEVYAPRWQAMFEAAQEGRFDTAVPPNLLRLNGLLYHRAVSLRLFEHYITPDYAGFEREFVQYARRLVRLPVKETATSRR